MIARVKTTNGTVYDTVVFAVIGKGSSCTIIGFDEALETLKYIPFYEQTGRSRLQIAIVESTKDNWIQDGDAEGYDWILSNPKRLEHIRLGRLLHPDFVAQCKALQDAVNLPAWQEVTDSKTVTDLMWAATGFHDAVILSVEKDGTDAAILLEIWGGTVELRLNNAEFHRMCTIGQIKGDMIYHSHIDFENGRINWHGYKFGKEEESEPMICHFSGTRMFWRIELE